MASVTVDSLQVLITANNEQLNRALREVSGQLGGMSEDVKKTSKVSAVAFGAIAGAAAALANNGINMITNSIDGAIKRVDTLNNSSRTFENMGIKADDAKKAMNALEKSITGLPTPLDSAVRGMTALTATYGDVDKGQKIFSALNNAVLGFGGSTEMVDNAILQLSQRPMDGPLDAQTWNSLLQSGLTPVINAMAKDMGKSVGELKEAFGEGELTVEDFTKALVKMDKEGGGGMKSLEKIARDSTNGISTGFSNMQTAITRGVAAIVKSLGSENISSAISNIGKGFEGVLTSVATVMPQILALIGSLATSVGDYLGPKFQALWNTIQNQFIPALHNAMIALTPLATALGTVLVVAVGLAVSVFTGLISALSAVLSNTQLLQSVIIPLTVAFVAYKGAIMAVNAVQLLQAAYAAATGTSYMLLNGQLVAVRTATIAQTVAQKALNLAMSMNPIGLVTAAVVGITAAYIAATTQTNNNKSAEDRLSDARRAAKIAGDDLTATEDKLKGARLGLEGSTLQVERAQRTYTDAVEKYGPKSLEAREAAYQLKRANEDLKAANDKVKEATDNKRKAEEEVVKKKQSVKDAEVAKAVEFYKTKDSIVSQTNSLLTLNGSLTGLNGKNFQYTVTEARRVVGDGVSSPAAKQAAADRLSRGYALGGFTGRGGKYDIAGIVHKGEYVLPKELVNQSTGLPKSFSNSNASSDFGDNSQPLIINVGGERLVDTVIEGINGRSFLGGSSVINV